jgi:nitrogen fixation protein NifX
LKPRVAVASSDGRIVNRHFGHAEQFFIFELSEGTFSFLELRENRSACRREGHDADRLAATAELLGDCSYVVASQIGPAALPVLLGKGIRPYIDADFVEETLRKLLASEKPKRSSRRRETDARNLA